jgi:hypothetical protein
MPMEQHKDSAKKTEKDVSNKVTEQEFVKLSDLTKEMFESLPKMMVRLECRVAKKSGYRTYQLTFSLHDQLLNNVRIVLKEDDYNLMRMRLGLPLVDERNKERMSYNLKARYRFVKGMNEIKEYYSIEIILAKGVYKLYYFNDYYQLEILKGLEESKEITINWYDRPDKVSSAETVNLSWEEQR